jgi:hypothetical protein
VNLGRAILVACAALLSGQADAQPPAEFWRVPRDAVAFWAVDPGPLGGPAVDRNRELVEAALAWGVPASAGAEPGPLLSAVGDRETLGQSPYRLALLSFAATCQPPIKGDPRPASIDHLETVLEIDQPAHPEAVIERLRKDRSGNGWLEAAVTLPGNRQGQRLSKAEAPTATIEWCQDHGALVVGEGAGSLAQWYEFSGPADAFAEQHGAALPHQGRTAVIGWVNLNTLRERAPELFAYGRYARLLQAWELSNSRSLYLSGRIVAQEGHHPPLLALSAAWSPRSEPTTSIHKAELTERSWPGSVPFTGPADCVYAIVAHADWRGVVNGALGTAESLAPSPTAFQERFKRWSSDHASPFVQTVKSLDDYAVVYGPTAADHSAAATIYSRRDASGFAGNVTSLSAALAPVVTRSGVTGAFRTQSNTKPAPPWAGLQWSLDRTSQRLDLVWISPAPTSPR